jgi:hypothetical protein
MAILAPYMLTGLLLAAIPIVIHLLNRRRFIRVEWAPMAYLKLTLKANKRRLRIEQILLLVIRTLIVVFLFLALARLLVSGDSFASFFAANDRIARVIIIDDSLSMGYQSAEGPAIDRAKAVVSELLKQIGPQDSLSVFTTSAPDRPIVRQMRQEQPEDLASRILAIQPAHSANNWAVCFKLAEIHLKEAAFPIQEVVVITDLRQAGWGDDLSSVTDAWRERGVRLRLVDVGVEATENVVLESVRTRTQVPLVDTDISFVARIRNDGVEAVGAADAIFEVDDSSRVIVLPDMAAGQTVEVPLVASFQEAGQHRLALTLPGDALPQDSMWVRVLNVATELYLQTVDGEPGGRPFSSETDFLKLAFSVGRKPWRVTQTIDSEWLDSPLTAPDVLVLANVASLPRSRADALEKMVESGMGLMIFPGEQVDVGAYNEILYRNGQGLLPAKLDQIRDQETTGLIIESMTDSPLQPLLDLPKEALARIRIKRVVETYLSDENDVHSRVLARWNDPQRSPAVIEKRHGLGRVLLWTIAADKQWSDWPTEPSYVLAMRQSVAGIAAERSATENATAGEPLHSLFDPLSLPRQITVTPPGGADAVHVSLEQRNPEAPQAVFSQTRAAGIYEMKWSEADATPHRKLFAVNPDIAESRLERISRDQLAQRLVGLAFEVLPYSGKIDGYSRRRAELWRSFIFAMLFCIFMETVLAAWIGRSR